MATQAKETAATHRDALPAVASPQRRMILEHVRRRPGLPMGEIAQRAGLAWGSASYHVARLEATGLLRTVLVGRRRLIYPEPMPTEATPELDALLLDPTRRRVAHAIVASPACGIQDIIVDVDVSPRVAYHHVKALCELELVEAARRYRLLRPTLKLLGLVKRRS